MGEKPPAFDLLYWNSDGTRMARAAHGWYLRNTYKENNLVKPGKIELKGEPIDLGRISLDPYAVGAEKDHIVPWDAAWRITQLSAARCATCSLPAATSPASSIRRRQGAYWTTRRTRRRPRPRRGAAATQHDGSWWTDWTAWLARAPGEGQPPASGQRRTPAARGRARHLRAREVIMAGPAPESQVRSATQLHGDAAGGHARATRTLHPERCARCRRIPPRRTGHRRRPGASSRCAPWRCPQTPTPPADTSGGWITSLMDVAGGITATALAQGRVATVAVTDMAFLRPVKVGDVGEGERQGEAGRDHRPVGGRVQARPPHGAAVELAPVEVRQRADLGRAERRRSRFSLDPIHGRRPSSLDAGLPADRQNHRTSELPGRHWMSSRRLPVPCVAAAHHMRSLP